MERINNTANRTNKKHQQSITRLYASKANFYNANEGGWYQISHDRSPASSSTDGSGRACVFPLPEPTLAIVREAAFHAAIQNHSAESPFDWISGWWFSSLVCREQSVRLNGSWNVRVSTYSSLSHSVHRTASWVCSCLMVTACSCNCRSAFCSWVTVSSQWTFWLASFCSKCWQVLFSWIQNDVNPTITDIVKC